MFVKLAVVSCFLAVGLAKWTGPLAGGLPAHQHPAGVSPQACPNYPHCENPAVAVNPTTQYVGAYPHGTNQWNSGAKWNNGNQWNGGNQWNDGHQWNNGNQWNGGHQWNDGHQWNSASKDQWNHQASPLDKGEYTGDGDYRGEGLAESGAFGPHPSWNKDIQATPAWNAAPVWKVSPAWNGVHAVPQPAQLPAGVDAHSCPNYPYCH